MCVMIYDSVYLYLQRLRKSSMDTRILILLENTVVMENTGLELDWYEPCICHVFVL